MICKIQQACLAEEMQVDEQPRQPARRRLKRLQRRRVRARRLRVVGGEERLGDDHRGRHRRQRQDQEGHQDGAGRCSRRSRSLRHERGGQGDLELTGMPFNTRMQHLVPQCVQSFPSHRS